MIAGSRRNVVARYFCAYSPSKFAVGIKTTLKVKGIKPVVTYYLRTDRAMGQTQKAGVSRRPKPSGYPLLPYTLRICADKKLNP